MLGLAHHYKINNNNTLIIAGTVVRNDNLNDDAIKVNKILRYACSKRNIGFIDNKNTNPI